MEKRKRIESGEILFPEPIVHHIQSFMTGKEAAQTSVLSKHWYSAWSTRPNLDFDHRDFKNRDGQTCDDRIQDFAKKTIERYEELNLTIESIGLRVIRWEKRRLSLYNELILKAIQMGAKDLKLQLMGRTKLLSLPKELLGSENLVKLSASECTIDVGVNGMVSWSRLKSLSLQKVYFEGDVISDVILSCPLIEELMLSECFFKVHISDHVPVRRNRMLTLSTNQFELRKLKCLSLKKVKIDTSFFCDFSFKFPCLKDLTVDECSGYKAIQISSTSLERISFVVQKKMLKATFEVPCIRKFTFSGLVLPCLSFGTSSFVWKWESDISVRCSGNDDDRLTPSWFLKLQKFLVNLSPSRISLTLIININCQDRFNDIKGLAKPPIVDNLRVLIGASSLDCCALLNGLFLSCRPKLISFPGGKADNNFLELLCQRLSGRLRGIKKVNVEFYEENLSQWGPPLPLKALVDGCPENKQNVRLKLIWG
ncbi:hypothetical protein CASFOL_000830 [Castilleja foliolosa]|uniref:F-box/LRR-repeat protein 15/At3g58940/PEG3-like LRR domain-containing protein n=1 Tax=Castilleja foliolosa TaxID=1961234 RepID=A0ABD3EP90_9LAMI